MESSPRLLISFLLLDDVETSLTGRQCDRLLFASLCFLCGSERLLEMRRRRADLQAAAPFCSQITALLVAKEVRWHVLSRKQHLRHRSFVKYLILPLWIHLWSQTIRPRLALCENPPCKPRLSCLLVENVEMCTFARCNFCRK